MTSKLLTWIEMSERVTNHLRAADNKMTQTKPSPSGNGEKVTISDCGKALEAIHQELDQIARRKAELRRKEAALRTQALIIQELVRRIA